VKEKPGRPTKKDRGCRVIALRDGRQPGGFMYKLACIYSRYPDISEAAEEIIKRTGWHIEFSAAVFDQAVKLAKEYEEKGFDLIISRGVSGTLIQNSVHIPVILIEITPFDVLQTIHQARQYGNKIAFFQFFNHRHYWDFAAIKKILDIPEIDINIFYYRSEQELKNKIKGAIAGGVDVVVGTGSYVQEIVRLYGGNMVMVHSTKESIYNAFKQAEDILRIRTRDQILLQYKSALLDRICEGYVLLNDKEEVVYANEGAYRLLGLRRVLNHEGVVLPKNIKDAGDNELVEVNGRRLLVGKNKLTNQTGSIGSAVYLSYPVARKAINDSRKQETNDGQMALYSFVDIIGTSKPMTKVVNNAQIYARSDSNILITGESGTGKEVFAHSIHNFSARKAGPFVAINCATLPHSLLESELFGYEEGAFTGAKKGGNRGLFEVANRGTIFLDEISEITLTDQAQLLRVLQEKTIRRIGGKKSIPVDVRVIAATNIDLMKRVESGQFRLDLYYRLNILKLHLPPLRERKEDIPLLIDYFMKKQEKYLNIPDLLMEKFINYSWPGNVRELANFIEKFVILSANSDSAFNMIEELFSEFSGNPGADGDRDSLTVKAGTLREMELAIIKSLYERHGQDRAKLAAMLDISRTSLWMKLKEIDRRPAD
jgi:transcriptional regulator with PAS, ATPase and Fis domain